MRRKKSINTSHIILRNQPMVKVTGACVHNELTDCFTANYILFLNYVFYDDANNKNNNNVART